MPVAPELNLNAAIRDFDLSRYCAEHGGQELRVDEWLLTCPGCGKEKLTVTLRKQAWHCWVCEGESRGTLGRGGLLALVKMLDRCTTAEAVAKIVAGGRFQSLPIDRLPETLGPPEFDDRAEAPTILPPEYWQPIVRDGVLPYMLERGISGEDAVSFGLGWCSGGRYRGRLIFPVWENRRLVYFQARAMWSATQQTQGQRYIKALNPSASSGGAVSSDVLFNLDQARHYPRVAIVEGPIDAVKTGPSAVCTFGKRIYPRQIGKLLRAGVKAVDLMWDGPGPTEPNGALPEMLSAAPLLSGFFDVRVVLLDRGDPGDKSRDELNWYRKHRAYRADTLSPMNTL